jgi:hypothetical protein
VSNYRKLLLAIVGAVVLALQAAFTDGSMSTAEWVTVVAAALAAFGTWLMPNTDLLATAKTWVNALVLGAGVIVPLLADGLTQQEIWTAVIAVLTAAGVLAVRNVDTYGQHAAEFGGGQTLAGDPGD